MNGAEVKSGFGKEARHKRSGDRRSGLRLRSKRSESNLKAKLFELMDETFFFALTLELIKIVRAKFLILLGVSDDMVDNNQERMSQGYRRSLLPRRKARWW